MLEHQWIVFDENKRVAMSEPPGWRFVKYARDDYALYLDAEIETAVPVWRGPDWDISGAAIADRSTPDE